jgi:predicted XRE-type DNA-binding protein
MNFATDKSHKLTFEEAIEVQKMIHKGIIQSRIAAHFDVNIGRISEVKNGQLHLGSYEAAFGKKAA